jgi:hypothetical protein
MGTKGFFPGIEATGFEADNASHLVQRLRIRRAISAFPHMPSCCAQGKLVTIPESLRSD